MAAIGSAVGLGNIWRFPYVAYANGGGAFLIPYFVALLTAGIPLMMLEYAVGVKMQAGPPIAFAKIKKGLEWVGWWSILAAFVIITYYAVVMAWCWNYLYHSFTLAWGDNAGEFFITEVLQRSGGPGEIGRIVPAVLIGLVITWAVVYWIIYKGIGRVGKVVMATVPIPVILIAILVIRGITLPGAAEGLNFYLSPDFSKLLDPHVWLAAYGQIFFSLSLAMGIMIVYASYLPRKSDVTNNAFITSFANCGTSFFAGFAIFSTLGYLAYATGVDVSEVARTGLCHHPHGHFQTTHRCRPFRDHLLSDALDPGGGLPLLIGGGRCHGRYGQMGLSASAGDLRDLPRGLYYRSALLYTGRPLLAGYR
jgi:NSS family neurotransmitter:Na+ symporter